MSVPAPYRKRSSIIYLDQLFQLNAAIGTLVSKMPEKYKRIYGDMMIRTGMHALELALNANTIYVCKTLSRQLFDTRLAFLYSAKSTVEMLANIYHIYILILGRTDPEMTTKKRKQAIKNSENMVSWCNTCVELIGGVIRSDKARYKEYTKDLPLTVYYSCPMVTTNNPFIHF